MAEKVKLTNPPITEALVDIRVKHPSGFNINSFDDLNEDKLRDFPVKELQNEYSADVKVKPDKEPHLSAKSRGIRGFIYKTEDKKNIVQFRKDGFTFNRLKPYTNWEEFIAIAEKLWGIYLEKSTPLKVTRIATRFINQIKLPLPIEDFSDYMTTPPQNPLKNDVITGFLSRIQLHDLKDEIRTNIIQTLEKGTEAGEITLLLDIDTYISKDFSPQENLFWNRFDKLRKKKNDLFYSSITEKTINLYK